MEMLCAALAGIGARIPCHPLDTIKTVAFTGFAGEHLRPSGGSGAAAPPHSTFRHAARAIWEREGLRGFYRGLGVAALGSAPGVALYLSSYHYLSASLLAARQSTAAAGPPDALRVRLAAHTPDGVVHFTGGLGAEAVSCLVWVPIDVTKERLQSQPPSLAGRYTGSLDALRTIVRREGVRGLYKGYWSTLGSFGPFSAVYFVFYESFSHHLSQRAQRYCGGGSTHSSASPSFSVALVAGAAGNTVASLCTNPFELVKTRLQVQRAVLSDGGAGRGALYKYAYKGLRDGLVTIVKEEGLAALWKGVLPRIAYTAPNAALTMAMFEYFKSCL